MREREREGEGGERERERERDHTSTLTGQHSTALLRSTRASSGLSKSTAAFHSRTELGTFSSAVRR